MFIEQRMFEECRRHLRRDTAKYKGLYNKFIIDSNQRRDHGLFYLVDNDQLFQVSLRGYKIQLLLRSPGCCQFENQKSDIFPLLILLHLNHLVLQK